MNNYKETQHFVVNSQTVLIYVSVSSLEIHSFQTKFHKNPLFILLQISAWDSEPANTTQILLKQAHP